MTKPLTPMLQQYFSIKRQYEDCILFFRLGDFFEMFFDDALLASKELEITLTGRASGEEERAPMCGVPCHAADSYISRLVAKGYKVAICEQTEDPKAAKGIVKREVIRVVTPGTIQDEGLLTARGANYMCAIWAEGETSAVIFVEASTGRAAATYFESDKDRTKLINELGRFSPVEAVVNLGAHREKGLCAYLEQRLSAPPQLLNDDYFENLSDLERFGEMPGPVLRAASAVFRYLKETQKAALSHINEIEIYSSAQYMELDLAAQRNLELVETMRDRSKRGSLFGVLDETATRMGARVLKSWILRPLMNVAALGKRQAAVGELKENMELREGLLAALSGVYDIERLVGKIALATANARDLAALRSSLRALPQIRERLQTAKSTLLSEKAKNFDILEDIEDLLSRAIVDEPPIALREGKIIREGFSEEIDKLNLAMTNGRAYLAKLEAEEREKTGIRTLKVGFNKVFGYYIEVSKVNADRVPEHYIRKQTLAAGERFITPELKEIEGAVLGASERGSALEYETFISVRDRVSKNIERIQRTAGALATVDALCALGLAAAKNNYTCPVIDTSGAIIIKDGRHPVVEKNLAGSLFVPNDTDMGKGRGSLAIITGPNMAGKSTYMRQVALIVLMAQMGGFVPAAYCHIGVVDKIFTRVGASDDLAAGQSTFMVEMSEVASMLKGATRDSLLILDEIGRGTSTYDGLAIARAVAEHIITEIGAKTLFATHYHELTGLSEKFSGIKNYCTAVKKRGDDIIFLRKVIPGGADKSYGVEVAKLAGISEKIIDRAKKYLKDMESSAPERPPAPAKIAEQGAQIGLSTMAGSEIVDEMKKIDANVLSPIEALSKLYELCERAKEV